ncbi:MAG: aminoacyl-tRNA deacylase [Geminicoccaceae bacterium]|nr:aminoacyl-tRNA deacylase [Geminicoccaceae bacterium]MCX8101438.1 aminoacyl-tRNA deacylase [Geminicoccaceae bacterium]MDW8370397.1 aminoacyl-tRNA deacylase [Geminicoccaceae bacterium]
MARAIRARGGTPATSFLEARGIPFRAHAYAFDPAPGAIAEAAARALGVEPSRLLKCLILRTREGGLAAALLAADKTLDLDAAARALGSKRVELAPSAEAERATGYVKGGISPLGQRRPLPILLDRAALQHASVLVNGGRRGLQLELAPSDLVAATGARLADLGR